MQGENIIDMYVPVSKLHGTLYFLLIPNFDERVDIDHRYLASTLPNVVRISNGIVLRYYYYDFLCHKV